MTTVKDQRTVSRLAEVEAAARPFAVCTNGWAGRGYGASYTCLDREADIANPEHEAFGWSGEDQRASSTTVFRSGFVRTTTGESTGGFVAKYGGGDDTDAGGN